MRSCLWKLSTELTAWIEACWGAWASLSWTVSLVAVLMLWMVDTMNEGGLFFDRLWTEELLFD
jgi:hypothetical protein